MRKKDKRNKEKIKDSAQENEVFYTEDEVAAELDELAVTPKRKRVWEVDFLRGFMILFVVWDHLMYDIYGVGGPYNTAFFRWLDDFAYKYSNGVLRETTHDVFVTLFVFTSGVSCSFSNNNGKRAIKMIAFACILTLVTDAVSAILDTNLTIRFNVIHVIALSVSFWVVIEFCWKKCSKNWQKNIFGVVMAAVTLTALVVGACAKVKPWTSNTYAWFFLTEHTGHDYLWFCGGDYLPFFPDFGWFLVGAFLGKVIYKERKSIFPSVNPKWVSPITFCGKYSIWVYFVSQIVMFGLIYLLSPVLGWL